GHGECRMVFSGSEHLTRHVKNTPANVPLPAHCSKPFSHLANLRLRQHAQTAHADRTAQNEAMTCELATLHAPTSVSSASDANANTAANDFSSPKAQAGVSKRSSTKREPVEDLLGGPGIGGRMAQRPGTSTGYEGVATATVGIWMWMLISIWMA
ncbi:hypothetical protein B0H14DRAFT_2347372, partial [Mycena olivaceomarginata]